VEKREGRTKGEKGERKGMLKKKKIRMADNLSRLF